jgi:hypothetical protein
MHFGYGRSLCLRSAQASLPVHLENSRIHALTPGGASFQDGFGEYFFLLQVRMLTLKSMCWSD